MADNSDEAGYLPNSGNVLRMNENERVRARVAELVDAASLDRPSGFSFTSARVRSLRRAAFLAPSRSG